MVIWSTKLEIPTQIPDKFTSALLRELGAPDHDACRNAVVRLFSNGLATATIISDVLLNQDKSLNRREVQAEIANAAM